MYIISHPDDYGIFQCPNEESLTDKLLELQEEYSEKYFSSIRVFKVEKEVKVRLETVIHID